MPSEARTHLLHKLQQHLYETYLSPTSTSTYTQSSLFTHYAPLALLLALLALPRYTALLPSFPSASSQIPQTQIPQIIIHLLLGACTALLALRACIWAGARVVWAFCELDLGHARAVEKIRGEGVSASASAGARGEEAVEMELTQGNLIFGGLFA
ncbi:hypothetical protein C0992_009004 [Termitomyces sp. T32_za158]|nr:hypothetical protein C0992_009004 [Termitomyces sp. T32_za158]